MTNLDNRPSLAFDSRFPGPLVGVDEVGYGPWAGPVVAAAVTVLNRKSVLDLEGHVDDSKKLTLKKREALFPLLTVHPAIAFGIGEASVEEIDRLNIREATFLAMRRALQHLPLQPTTLLIDGTGKLTLPGTTTIPVVGGDGKSFAIATASIIAKVTRDREMARLDVEYPHYGWKTNVGYGTRIHQEALEAHGPSPHHRRSYAPIAKFFK